MVMMIFQSNNVVFYSMYESSAPPVVMTRTGPSGLGSVPHLSSKCEAIDAQKLSAPTRFYILN